MPHTPTGHPALPATTDPADRPVTLRLNAFQELMRRWGRLHPYHAVHMVRLARPLNAGRLKSAADAVLRKVGFGAMELHPDGHAVTFHPGPADIEVATVADFATVSAGPAPSGEVGEVDLRAVVGDQLNRRFTERPHPPLRFAVLPDRDDAGDEAGGTWVVMCYDHWLGDGFAMAGLLHRILAEATGLPAAQGDLPLRLEWPDPFAVFGRRATFERATDWTLGLIRDLMRVRSCYGPRTGDADDMTASVRWVPVADDAVPRLRAAARARGGTLHDVLLAAVAEAVAGATPERHTRSRRRDLAIGSIVSLREAGGDALAGRLGLFLSYFNVFLRSPDAVRFDEAMRRIVSQTTAVKREDGHLRSFVDLWVGRNVWPRVWPESSAKRYRKHMPMAAGVSNVRLPDWYGGPWRGEVREYRRAVPTGPTTPLAVAPTTVGGRMTVGLTIRRSGFTDVAAETISAALADRLGRL